MRVTWDPRSCYLHTCELVCMHRIRCNILLPDWASQLLQLKFVSTLYLYRCNKMPWPEKNVTWVSKPTLCEVVVLPWVSCVLLLDGGYIHLMYWPMYIILGCSKLLVIFLPQHSKLLSIIYRHHGAIILPISSVSYLPNQGFPNALATRRFCRTHSPD